MLALLKKDFLVLKKSCAVYLALLVFYTIFGAVNGDFSMFNAFVVLMITIMLPVTSLSYDERTKWDVYGMSLPVSRRTVVLSKYAFTWTAALCCAGISLFVNTAFELVNSRGLSPDVLSQPLMLAGIGLLVNDLSMPVMYQFGVEKGRYIMMGGIWVIALGPMIIMKVFEMNLYDALEGIYLRLNSIGIAAGLLAVVVVVTALSLMLSTAIYERKELS